MLIVLSLKHELYLTISILLIDIISLNAVYHSKKRFTLAYIILSCISLIIIAVSYAIQKSVQRIRIFAYIPKNLFTFWPLIFYTPLIICFEREKEIVLLVIMILSLILNQIDEVHNYIRTFNDNTYLLTKIESKTETVYVPTQTYQLIETETCPICLEDLNSYLMLSCNHKIHKNCLIDMVRHNSLKCSMCRADIDVV